MHYQAVSAIGTDDALAKLRETGEDTNSPRHLPGQASRTYRMSCCQSGPGGGKRRARLFGPA